MMSSNLYLIGKEPEEKAGLPLQKPYKQVRLSK
jgi:hypothetical protein